MLVATRSTTEPLHLLRHLALHKLLSCHAHDVAAIDGGRVFPGKQAPGGFGGVRGWPVCNAVVGWQMRVMPTLASLGWHWVALLHAHVQSSRLPLGRVVSF